MILRSFCRPRAALMTVMCLLLSATASAQTMPWDGPLERIRDSLTGTFARAIIVIAIAICGATLIFGGELSEFTKRLVYTVLAASVMIFAGQVVSSLGLSG